MSRKKKTEIKVNDTQSLQNLMQETYNDACLQIIETQSSINELSTSAQPTDVDDITKIFKEKGNLLKVKDSAIKMKLELAKLQSDIIKSGGNAEAAIKDRSQGTASISDFKSIREMLKNDKKIEPEGE